MLSVRIEGPLLIEMKWWEQQGDGAILSPDCVQYIVIEIGTNQNQDFV